MKTYIYHPLILLVIILVTVSCENELPFNIKDNPPKLVMNAFINADSMTNVLFLNLTGKDYANHIENATVEVHVNGELRETLRFRLVLTGFSFVIITVYGDHSDFRFNIVR